MREENKFYTEEPVPSCEKLDEKLQALEKAGHWVYRGQHSKWELETTLERYCNLSRYPFTDAPDIETEMIRNFQRLYSGEDRKDVVEDELYCISLMRHYGAPSRLIDFTYSKDVAMYFGIECAFDNVSLGKDREPAYDKKRGLAIWCINTDYTDSQINEKYPDLYLTHLGRSANDVMRDNVTFQTLYKNNTGDFVQSENPVKLHHRLDIQHGVFLCPGNVTISFMKNLSNLVDSNSKSKIIKFTCELSPTELRDLLEEFRKKTITRQSLLPGPDGFAQSMKYKLVLFKNICEGRDKARKKREELLTCRKPKRKGLKR